MALYLGLLRMMWPVPELKLASWFISKRENTKIFLPLGSWSHSDPAAFYTLNFQGWQLHVTLSPLCWWKGPGAVKCRILLSSNSVLDLGWCFQVISGCTSSQGMLRHMWGVHQPLLCFLLLNTCPGQENIGLPNHSLTLPMKRTYQVTF